LIAYITRPYRQIYYTAVWTYVLPVRIHPYTYASSQLYNHIVSYSYRPDPYAHSPYTPIYDYAPYIVINTRCQRSKLKII